MTQPTTAAQYFHLLRSQVHQSHVRPLVVGTPKSLLRAPFARSDLSQLTSGGFAAVLDDDSVDPAAVRRIVLCSGKIAYDAIKRRNALAGSSPAPAAGQTAIVRVEQIYPWPGEDIEKILARYPGGDELVWLQEEPENMGAWSFVHGRLHRILRNRLPLRHVSRPESASPATGSAALHQLEQSRLVELAIP